MMRTMVSRGTASGYWHQVQCYIPTPRPQLVPHSKKPHHPQAQVSAQPLVPCTKGAAPRGSLLGKKLTSC